jgi:hypothetical protein
MSNSCATNQHPTFNGIDTDGKEPEAHKRMERQPGDEDFEQIGAICPKIP